MQHCYSVRFQCSSDTSFFFWIQVISVLAIQENVLELDCNVNPYNRSNGMSNPPTGSCTLDCIHSKLLFIPIEVHNHKFVHIPGSQYKGQPKQLEIQS